MPASAGTVPIRQLQSRRPSENEHSEFQRSKKPPQPNPPAFRRPAFCLQYCGNIYMIWKQRMTPKHHSERSDWRAQEMLLLQQVIQNLGKDGGAHHTALKIMLQLMSEFFGLNQGRIVLQHTDDENASIRYAYGMSPEQIARGVYAPGEGITGTVLRHSHMIAADNVRTDPLFLTAPSASPTFPPNKPCFSPCPSPRTTAPSAYSPACAPVTAPAR
ncbi:GAF domain-containing protein [Kingella potus]|uniref:GAF domain-containing protein n=1 Tax=Kingella potus TaxID=265175 RepID=UPI001FD0B834|nr:GAF domain-containing protein [Kingella potus]UOP00997.1 hypothetical protein LVJ84_00925 [Kingella potus]